MSEQRFTSREALGGALVCFMLMEEGTKHSAVVRQELDAEAKRWGWATWAEAYHDLAKEVCRE